MKELVSESIEIFASTWILERTPHIFAEDRKLFLTWKHQLGNRLGVDPIAISLVGSSAVGVSLNPNKNFKLFDVSSDIDVAVVSDYYFTEAWRTLRRLGTDLFKLSPGQRASVSEHVSKYIYWGTFATDRLLPILPFAKHWISALEDMQTIDPTKGRQIKIRLYRDFDSLRSYHLSNIRELRNKLLS
jgi:hypothetical protein